MKRLIDLWILSAVAYFVLGVGLGVVMGATHDHTLRPVHAHVNLLGWTSMGVSAFIHHYCAATMNFRLAQVQFWLYQLNLPVMLILLALLVLGNAAVEPLLGISSVVQGMAVLLLALNVWRGIVKADEAPGAVSPGVTTR